MIHATDAALADATVVGSWRTVGLTPGAHGPFAAVAIARWIDLVVGGVQVGEVQAVGGQGHYPGIGKHGLGMRHGQEEDHGVEEHHMEGHPEAKCGDIDQ